MQLITSAVVAVSLLTALLLIDTPLAVSAATLLVVLSLLGIVNRRELRRNGQKITEASRQQWLQEGLGAIRDVF